MKRSAFFLLLSIFLLAFQTGDVPVWQTEIDKAITSLKPEFRTKDTKFAKITLEQAGINKDSANAELGLPKEVYRKEISLRDPETKKKFTITLEVYVTKDAEQAEIVQKQLELLDLFQEAFQGKGGFTCSAPGKTQRPCYTIFYANNLIMLSTENLANQKTFDKYGEAFGKALTKK
jgi:hypothetical protein